MEEPELTSKRKIRLMCRQIERERGRDEEKDEEREEREKRVKGVVLFMLT